MSQETTVAMREIITKDEFGHTLCIHYKDFWGYLESKKVTKHELLKLSPEKRESIFMKWKHGMNDISNNWEFEHSLRDFLKTFEGMSLDQVDPYFRRSLKMKREFDSYCDSILHQIGIWGGKRDVPPEVKRLIDSVGGTLVAELVDKT